MPKPAVPDWVHDEFEYTLTMYNPAGEGLLNIEMNREEYEELKRVLAIRRGYVEPKPPPDQPPAVAGAAATTSPEERFGAFMRAPIRKP